MRKKGIQYEGMLRKMPETIQDLNDDCYGQWGTCSCCNRNTTPKTITIQMQSWLKDISR